MKDWQFYWGLIKKLDHVKINKKDIAVIIIASATLLLISLTCWRLLGEVTLILLPTIMMTIMLVVLLGTYRGLSEENKYNQFQTYRQIEALFSLFFTFKPNLPLPETRDWAASPDLLRKITELVFLNKPELVVEAGSGVSTLLIAYSLKQIGKGKLISLEHDGNYAQVTQNLILQHGLDSVATVVHAPLETVSIDGRDWFWYQTHSLKFAEKIDLLIIDGPPWHVQPLSRYPALPLLNKELSKNVRIVMDDGNREDEREVVKLWEREFDMTSEPIFTEKGAYLLRRSTLLEKNCSTDIPISL